MPDNAPLRGADAVNDGELEVGFDAAFEDRFHVLEIIGRIFLCLIVAAGLGGFLGRGPFGHSVSATNRTSVDYEPVTRYGTATQVTLHLHPAPGQHMAEITIDTNFVEPMGLQQIEPRPLTAASTGGGERLTFAIDPDAPDTLVRFVLKPSEIGVHRLSAQVTGGALLRWRQGVVP